MADDLENSRQWRDTVETRLGKLDSTVGEQARLRAAMDEDLSKLHVERNMLQALHDTQSDHTKRLSRLESTQSDHTKRLTRLEKKMDLVQAGVTAIRNLLEGKPSSGD